MLPLFYLELVCQLEATNRRVLMNTSENRKADAILDCLFTSEHHPADDIYHLINSGYGANQIAVFVIDSD